ncbi:transglycosylase SLT domain-containing protein [Vibrio ziniensis]|uniref:Transglycosylase SLT domain-containing protein n=1 Tax=Vibrio ziniensis TaxID=2711221 RepID=A0A6G7CLI4_9VIBR|nr:transglycosylase SLT domain-containing protein [Vibrio ziniensis]QIH42962.1 transglycosylase SLT domain-containing protein [Vibrio ziniensis]
MRLFNKTIIALSLLTLFSPSFAANKDAFAELDQATQKAKRSQSEINQEFIDYINHRLDEYEKWREDYTKQLDEQRKELINQWGSAEISDKTTDVEYSSDDTVKKVIDYDNNTATVSVLVDASVSEAQAKQLIKKAQLADGITFDPRMAQVSEESVNYSKQREDQERTFILQQTQQQMNEYDIQAERLISANTGIPDEFIYQRAHNKKMALIEEAKKRMLVVSRLYQAKRQQLEGTAQAEPKPASHTLAKPAVAKPVVTKPAVEKPAAQAVEKASEQTAQTLDPQKTGAPQKTAKPIVAEPSTAANESALAKTAVPVVEQPLVTEEKPVESTAVESAQVEPAQLEPVSTDAAIAVAQVETPVTDALPVEEVAANDEPAPVAKKVISYKISLPNNNLAKRASQYQPMALQESDKWSVDPALVMAIMHSESAFRPDAKSHVPAFGLMQIVPSSAGRDVNKQVRNIDAPMEESDLYQPPINVETGTAYLHILNDKYLSNIKDDKSRLYCTIAAYNTGAGNVARAFNSNRSTNIQTASEKINSMTPDQVYTQLIKNLPYDETKNYLKKVSSRMALYQPENAL